MRNHLRATLWLLFLTLSICSVLYPLALWGIGRLPFFRDQAQGSLIVDAQGKVIGSRLIAQPFTSDEFFQPRPSAASYNGMASSGSNWGASNYLLRERVARQLGPVVKYHTAEKKGQLVAPDIEAWFQKDQFSGSSGIVAQWAQAHGTVAQNWVKADKLNAEYVAGWQKTHPDEVAQWIKDNPDISEPKPEDLAVPFFTSYAKAHPGTFPGVITAKTPDGKDEKRVGPVKEGTDIQGIFFDMWRQEHPAADLEPVPADMVMASGSGLDPHITLKNAFYQLDRVAAKWAEITKRDQAQIRGEIEKSLRAQAEAPFGGLVGEPLVNVLEANLALGNRYGAK